MIWVRPATVSSSAGAAPVYGTPNIEVPLPCMNCSAAKRGAVPLPAEA